MKTPETTTILLARLLIIIGTGCAHTGAENSVSYLPEVDGNPPQSNAATLIVSW